MLAASRQDQGNPLVHVFDLWVVEAKTNLDLGRPDFNSGDPNLLSVGNAAANETAVVVDSDTLIGRFCWISNNVIWSQIMFRDFFIHLFCL